MKMILLTQGMIAQVDDEDYEELSRYTWCLHRNGRNCYAKRAKPGENRTIIYMHCQIMGTKGIDHIDVNGLNNQKNNLRSATQTQNGGNSRKQNNTSSNFKGVSWSKVKRKYRAYIRVRRQYMHLGWFAVDAEAALAYDIAAQTYFGEFARLNFPMENNNNA